MEHSARFGLPGRALVRCVSRETHRQFVADSVGVELLAKLEKCFTWNTNSDIIS